IVDASREQLLETDPGRRVVRPSSTLQHAAVDDVLSQRVLEAVHRFGLLSAREDEVEAVELAEMSSHLIGAALEDARDQRHSEPSPDDRRPLERLLEPLGQAVDAGCDDVVSGRRHRDVGAAEPRLAALDREATGLLELAENLLHIEWIALAPFSEELEKLLGDFFDGKQGTHHPADVGGAEPFESECL